MRIDTRKAFFTLTAYQIRRTKRIPTRSFTESTARALALQIAARARIVDLIFFSMTLYLVDRIIKLDDV